MTSQQIRNKIRNNNNNLDQYYEEKKRIERELDELEQLKNKFAALQKDFLSRQTNQLKKLTIYFLKGIQNKIFKSYYEGMKAFLSGGEFVKTYDGLSEAKSKIVRKINELIDELDDCEDKIRYLKYQNADLQSQLMYAEKKEAEERAREEE